MNEATVTEGWRVSTIRRAESYPVLGDLEVLQRHRRSAYCETPGIMALESEFSRAYEGNDPNIESCIVETENVRETP